MSSSLGSRLSSPRLTPPDITLPCLASPRPRIIATHEHLISAARIVLLPDRGCLPCPSWLFQRGPQRSCQHVSQYDCKLASSSLQTVQRADQEIEVVNERRSIYDRWQAMNGEDHEWQRSTNNERWSRSLVACWCWVAEPTASNIRWHSKRTKARLHSY